MAVLGNADALAGDLGGEDEVLEGLLVDGGEGARAGALLAELGARLARLLGEDAALSDEDDELVGKLLLKLTGEAGVGKTGITKFWALRRRVEVSRRRKTSQHRGRGTFEPGPRAVQRKARGGGPKESLRLPAHLLAA